MEEPNYKPYHTKNNIDGLNQFIHTLNKTYHLSLNVKTILYSGLLHDFDETITLNEEILEKKTRAIAREREQVPEEVNENKLLNTLDNEWLKDYKHYIPKTLQIDKKDYYLNSQYGFYDSVKEILAPLMDYDKGEDSCGGKKEFLMLQHQKIVQTYLNSYTPYRGLLLYHGLGSGKTCSSISILEGLKEERKIFIMTPASLQKNYRTQMKFCGDIIFRNNHCWKFVSSDEHDNIYKLLDDYLILHHSHYRKITEYIDSKKGVWMICDDEPNYESLSSKEKTQVNEWIDLLMETKYQFINYNGLKKKKWLQIKGTSNPFENSVIVIDEAHNFVGQIHNKLKTNSQSVSTEMYESIMKAQKCKVVLLSGTPYTNQPSELAVMINLISGYTILHEFVFEQSIKKESILEKLDDDIKLYSNIEFTRKSMKIIRNPHGFITTPSGVQYQKDSPYVSDEIFIENIKQYLKDYKINVNTYKYKRMPDDEKEFNSLFVKTELSGPNQGLKVIDRKQKFQTRIAGLISYLGDKTSLMPRLRTPVVERIKMSGHQLTQYKHYETRERKMKGPKGDTSYKVFTRAACNFVFDDGPLERPFPEKITNEKDFDYVKKEERLMEVDALVEDGDVIIENKPYDDAISKFIANVLSNRDQLFYNTLEKMTTYDQYRKPNEEIYGLDKYSPKFKKILENMIQYGDSCHLLYSSFRRIEGIEMLRILLKYQGYQELVIYKDKSGFNIRLEGDYNTYKQNKVFALYTGTEEKEAKEIIRNIYNSQLEQLPMNLRQKLIELYGEELHNLNGDLVQLLMITASGAEGIDLQNTRYVHIMEPYWHHVRIDQVIGRARRICSHNRLPKEKQNVKVFHYISEMDKEKKEESTDQYLEKIMNNKKILSESFLNSLKEVAIDCNDQERRCFSYPVKEESEKILKVYEEDFEKEQMHKTKKGNDYFKKVTLLYEGKKREFKVDNEDMVYDKGKKIGMMVNEQVMKLE